MQFPKNRHSYSPGPDPSRLGDVKETGGESLFLEVENTNNSAIGLYENLGFVRRGSRKGYYGKKKDALIMKKDLR